MGLRDKMLPKSEEELSKTLGHVSKLKYERTTDSKEDEYMLDRINVSYNDLVEIFGEPKILDNKL
jgi:hypothetical protein